MTQLQKVYLSVVLLCYFTFTVSATPSVVIVGAGAAGISAATKLLENGITNITILEAQNRIGGRIHSVEFGGGFVDVGAQYCHGEEGNIVFQLVKNLNILEHSNASDPNFVKVYTSDGHLVEADLSEDLLNFMFSSDDLGNGSTNITLEEALIEVYTTKILKKYKQNKNKFLVAKDAIKFVKDASLVSEGAYSLQALSTESHFVQSSGDNTWVWKIKGYGIILDVLMKSYPDPSQKLPIDDKIYLNKTAEKISWSGDQAQIKISDGSTLSADHVIFTPSIGVLKHYKDTLFEPELPQEKHTAINAIGFDGVMKIILHFPTKWWNDDISTIGFIWKSEDLLNVTNEFPDGPHRNNDSWVTHVATLIKVRKNYNVLIGWFTGDMVPELEKTSDDVILRGCNYIIKKFLGKAYNVTDADKVIKSQWKTNPNIRGAYSFERFGYYEKNVSYQNKLAQPLVNDKGNPVVLFAGEATNPIHYSTVHGAIETGRREAERIINLSKQK